MHSVISFLKTLGFILNCLWVIPTQSLVLLLVKKGKLAYVLPRLWHKIICLVFGIKVIVEGKPAFDKQTLYMSNHVSYLDIPVIGSILLCSFVAKSEISGWPIFGYLASLQQTAYVVRKRTEAQTQANELQERLENGESLIIFPEGTSTDATHVIPFKSSLFSLAYSKPDLYVQPVSVVLQSADGKAPNTQDIRDIYAWHGDMDLVPHIKALMRTSGAVVKVIFHEALPAASYENRKVLAKTTYDTVCMGTGLQTTQE